MFFWKNNKITFLYYLQICYRCVFSCSYVQDYANTVVVGILLQHHPSMFLLLPEKCHRLNSSQCAQFYSPETEIIWIVVRLAFSHGQVNVLLVQHSLTILLQSCEVHQWPLAWMSFCWGRVSSCSCRYDSYGLALISDRKSMFTVTI